MEGIYSNLQKVYKEGLDEKQKAKISVIRSYIKTDMWKWRRDYLAFQNQKLFFHRNVTLCIFMELKYSLLLHPFRAPQKPR